MTVVTSGAISLLAIQNEFGGGAPIGINEYYRGGLNVNSSVAAGTGSFSTAPLSATSPSQIPASGTIQLSQFYGTQSTIIGNTGLIVPPTENQSVSDYVEVTLPAGVDLIRFFMVGGAGGAGGNDATQGGSGGGGSYVQGTISTSFAGSVSSARTLRFYVGRGGNGGLNQANGDSSQNFYTRGGSGFTMNGLQSTSTWSAWMNQYAVSPIGNKGGITTPGAGVLTSRMVFFPTTTTYVFQMEADNQIVVSVDGTVTAGTNGQNDTSSTNTQSFKLASPMTKTTTVSAGWHKLTFMYVNQDSGSAGGYAVRIINQSSSAEIWNTRYEYAATTAHPVGGNGGLAGNNDTSGFGGGGAAGTRLTLVVNGVEYFIACAGGGGGGGGGSATPIVNFGLTGSILSQGWIQTNNPVYCGGGDGEIDVFPADGGAPSLGNDGGGGGGGGGGILNNRMFFQNSAAAWLYSGMGGRLYPYYPNSDYCADGGESGKSAVTSNGTKYADLSHRPSIYSTPNLPSVMPISFGSYGIGAVNVAGRVGGTVQASGASGCAYVDWGTSNGTNAVAPSYTRSGATTVRAYAMPSSVDTTYGQGSSPNFLCGATAGGSWSVDAFGGGGNPAGEYTYVWSVAGAGASLSTTSGYTTRLSVAAGTIGSGSITATVTDADGHAASTTLFWQSQDDTAPPDTSGNGGGT
jgi:hypothetical protein